MSEYQHDTDKIEGKIISNCVNCNEYSVILEYEDVIDNDVLDDFKDLIPGECPQCGSNVSFIDQKQPIECLE